MKWLLILMWCTLCVSFPVVALAGNTNPELYLEIFMYDTDPQDPDYGCAVLETCPELCWHSRLPWAEPLEMHCYSVKAAYFVGVVPIHVNHLDSPVAQGWPPPCGPGGGYIGVSCGISSSGAAVTFTGFAPCFGFVQGVGTAPQAIVVSATTACHGVFDHPGYCKFMTSTGVGATYFDITSNADDGTIKVINCQGSPDAGFEVAGRAQWGGVKIVACYYVPVEPTAWGKIKALYR